MHAILTPSRNLPAPFPGFDPDEIRRLVQVGRDRGLIRDGATAAPVEKMGDPVAAEGGLRSLWMEVDPSTARRWLENNFRNRPLKEDVVIAYARDMLAGVWVPTHQGIAFNDRDELIDGQHRLHAVVRSGVTIRMMVTFGLPSVIAGSEMTTMDAVDRGKTRSVADQLTIQHGLKHGTVLAAICAGLANLCSGERTRRLSVGQTLSIYRTFQQPVDWVIERRAKQAGLRTTGVLVGFAFAAAADWGDAGVPADRAVTPMFERLNRGEGLGAKTALGALRRFLLTDEAKLLTTMRTLNRGIAELTLEAIRLERTGWWGERLEMSPLGADEFRYAQLERADQVAEMFKLP